MNLVNRDPLTPEYYRHRAGYTLGFATHVWSLCIGHNVVVDVYR